MEQDGKAAVVLSDLAKRPQEHVGGTDASHSSRQVTFASKSLYERLAMLECVPFSSFEAAVCL